jgi:hypothetical protein
VGVCVRFVVGPAGGGDDDWVTCIFARSRALRGGSRSRLRQYIVWQQVHERHARIESPSKAVLIE